MNTVQLGKVAATVMGQAPPGKECNTEGRGTVFVKAGEFNGRHPIVREWTTRPLRIAAPADVLVCVVGATAGKVSASIDCAIGRSVAALRPNRDKLHTDFLYHFLCTQTHDLRAKSQGLAQGVITREMLENIALPLPPLDEQRRIAAILDQADDLRRKRREALGKLRELKSIDFESTFLGANFPSGRIEDLTASTQYGSGEKAGGSGQFPVLRMGNLTYDGEVDTTDLKYFDLSRVDLEKFTLKPGDILFNRTNSPDLVGKTAVFRQSADTYAYAGYLIRLRVNDRADADFVSAYLNSKRGKTILRNMCKAIIGMANINAQELRKIPIPIPPLDLQRAFADRVAEIDKLRSQHRTHLAKLDALFASLQHRAFRGEL